MARHRFSVLGKLDAAAGFREGTVSVDRTAGTFAVRPKRRRREYVLPLGFVATMVCLHVLKVEHQERMKAKGAKRRHPRRGRL